MLNYLLSFGLRGDQAQLWKKVRRIRAEKGRILQWEILPTSRTQKCQQGTTFLPR